MIKGMTGFGSAQLSAGTIKATVEIKSVNHRYFDMNYYLPIGFGSIERKIHQLVQKSVQRGRVTVSIKITERPGSSIVLHKDVVKKHVTYAKQLKKEFGFDNDLTLSDIIRLPGVLESKETLVNPDKVWTGLRKALTKALAALEQMRKSEGRSLCADVADKLKKMTTQVRNIQVRSKAILKDKKSKLTVEEFTSLQKSTDINEEISRLKHYIQEV